MPNFQSPELSISILYVSISHSDSPFFVFPFKMQSNSFHLNDSDRTANWATTSAHFNEYLIANVEHLLINALEWYDSAIVNNRLLSIHKNDKRLRAHSHEMHLTCAGVAEVYVAAQIERVLIFRIAPACVKRTLCEWAFIWPLFKSVHWTTHVGLSIFYHVDSPFFLSFFLSFVFYSKCDPTQTEAKSNI